LVEAELATLLDGLAAASFVLARGVRTLGLWLLGPVDAALRGLRRASDLPPLWLRRHAGRVAVFESAAAQTARLIRDGKHVHPDDLILDLGCGPGAMAPYLGSMLGPAGRYVGLDVHASSIRWCQRHFAADPRLQFVLADIHTPYSERGGTGASTYRLPLPAESVGFALAKSLFTHLLPSEAQQYLRELRRVLLPGRHVFLTAFLYEAGDVPAFPHADLSARIRWRRRGRPHAGVAYEHATFLGMIGDAGLRVSDFCAIFYPGRGRMTGQDILVLERE
jgi:SAM-dependent methyltransferase